MSTDLVAQWSRAVREIAEHTPAREFRIVAVHGGGVTRPVVQARIVADVALR
ncbi:MAG TPA: hypothetical protein VK778_01470 [Solirubrobacteraceae bacterium]|jgi:hypothetical protein|nr:hypothetical protein [Solirubrobacteraceae bacterium]